jgi:hypothetical protein
MASRILLPLRATVSCGIRQQNRASNRAARRRAKAGGGVPGKLWSAGACSRFHSATLASRAQQYSPAAHVSPLPAQSQFPLAASKRNRILSDQRASKGLSFRSLPLKLLSLSLLIANLELELLASRTKLSLLTFSNRKKIAVFDPAPSPRICEPKKLSLPLAFRDARCRRRTVIHQHISNRNSRFTAFRSTDCKHKLYQISNRNKNAHFAFSDSTSASHQSHAATRAPRTTTRAAFRSTIPARPHADR